MPKQGLPVQGARALLNSWSDANAAIIKNGEKRKKEAAKAKKAGNKNGRR